MDKPTIQIGIRLTPEEHKKLKLEAVMLSKTLQDIVRLLIVDWLRWREENLKDGDADA